MKYITWTSQEIINGQSCVNWLRAMPRVLVIGLLCTSVATTAFAGPREQAKQMHDRLAGVPPTEAVLQSMEADIDPGQNNNPLAAANTAMSNPNFYNVTLKNFVAPWTNRDSNVFVPLNDYIATVVGMIRDDVPFNTLLSGDILYVASGVPGLPAYSNTNNNHYAQFEADGHDMMARLTQTTQSSVTGLPSTATAGIMTTRAAAEAFFIAGTNRAMFRFTMLNHMCNDMEQVHYLALPPDRIRQDVSRSPGGDSRLFLTNCVGCHNGMDPLAQAFAYYNFNETTGSIEYTQGQVQPKYFNNDANFPYGFRTPDDAWENRWRVGQNEFLGWDQSLPGSGNGAKSMGQELANSDAFASCQVKKVFRAVCLRDPEDASDRSQVTQMVDSLKFGSPAYSMKRTFAEAAVYCMGD
ncbi:MAG: hypothetical protein OEW68_02180 [Gammaproteobacteria bacterium]|nr:hypothetical protein [Gammaproteobacteria bacterium]MDH4313634.1 hypothetical protein [Gammaproteobacteria bacterium]MDH5213847.1 hypothetical protein [Gammaproteobacteria bacterium]